MESNKTAREELRTHLGQRIEEFSDPNTAEQILDSALALDKSIVYKLERQGEIMVLVVIGMRGDDEVYEIAEKRK